MLVGFTEQDYKNWAHDLLGYEKHKRTKKPFGKQFKPLPSIAKTQQIKQKERQFNPVLQKFNQKQKQINQATKQQNSRILSLDRYYRAIGRQNTRNYDIINLHGDQNKQMKQSHFKNIAPIRNLYNPINNQPLPQYYYKNRQLNLSPQKHFKNIKPQGREFDIVTGIYFYDNQLRKQQQLQQNTQFLKQKYESTHDYNAVYGRYYHPQRQKSYENILAKSQEMHSRGEQYNKRFPPGYLNREPLILDQTKPLTQSVIALDQRRQKAKQRYRLKYLIESQYEKRNIENEQKQERRIRNRVHNSFSMDHKVKQIDLSQLTQIKDELYNELVYKDKNLIEKKTEKYQNPQVSSLVSSLEACPSQKSSSLRNSRNFGRGGIKSGGFF